MDEMDTVPLIVARDSDGGSVGLNNRGIRVNLEEDSQFSESDSN